MVVIAKDGIQNESAPRWRYDYPSLVEAAESITDEMPESVADGFVCVEIPRYVYSAQLWIMVSDSDGQPAEYYTTRHECESFQKFTKGDARSLVWFDRDELYNSETVIGYHAPKRDEYTSYAIVSAEQAKACRKYTENEAEA